MEKTHVFIVGSKGIPAKYGGFETFVENLTARKQSDEIMYHVSCMNNDEKHFEYNGADCFNVKLPLKGAPGRILHVSRVLSQVERWKKSNPKEKTIVYILGCRIGPLLIPHAKALHRLNVKIFVNPDGLEWKRDKWNALAKKFLKYCEACLVKNADLVICDSINIEKYILQTYQQMKGRTTYIAYGADVKPSTCPEEKMDKWLESFALERNNYFLIVGRFVPENNYETMIAEFMKSNTSKPLVIITNIEKNKFYESLKKKTGFRQDKRIKFVGTVYDTELLKKIRECAYAYIHGHEVGGTNPSLLEALSSTKLNLLLDVGFNKEVGKNGGLYWSKEAENLATQIDIADSMEEYCKDAYAEIAQKGIQELYSWKYIIQNYETVFMECENSYKKILVVSNMYPSTLYPNYGVFVKHCVNILSMTGKKVTVVSLKKCVSKVKKIFFYGCFYIRSVFCGIFGKYDTIYAHYASHTAYPLLFIHGINKKIPIIMNVHGNDIVPDCAADERNVKRSYSILKKCSRIVCPSDYFKEVLIKNYEVPEKKITVYPSGGVNCKKFHKINRTQAIEHLSLDSDCRYIGYVSRIEEKKGWDIFLKACEPIVKQYPKIQLIVVGDGAQKSEYNALVKKLNLQDKITYFPMLSQDELVYVYNALDVFVFPTYRKSESLGLVGLEAMACECIVLASDQYGPASYVSNTINGYSFKTGDVTDAKRKIEMLFFEVNDAEKAKLKEGARATALQYGSEQTRHILVKLFSYKNIRERLSE